MLRYVTGARILGLLLVVATTGAAYMTLKSNSFALESVEGNLALRYTDAPSVLAAAGVPNGLHPSIFTLRTDEMRRKILEIPSIATADVRTVLPNRLIINVTERPPVFAIRRGGDEYLVDGSGDVLAHVLAAQAENLGIPIVEDERSAPDPIDTGTTVDPIELAAILQLGAVTPALIDSSAGTLALAMRDDDGFVMTAQPSGWEAIFGQYTPTLRPTDMIARQVQCLRSLVGASESKLKTVYLAPLDERCGTYLPIATPYVPTPAPTKSR